MAWFRLHESTLDNPKAQRLPPPLFKGWINMLCVASRYGGELPPIADIAFAMRKSEEDVRKLLAALVTANLVDQDETGARPHDWNEHQYKSDVSTGRVREFRKRKKERSRKPDETVSRNAPEQSRADDQASTRPDQSAPAERSSKVAPRASAPGGARAGASGLPAEDPWEQRFANYKPGGFWSSMWGPRPESGHCQAPADLLAKWQAAHPKVAA